MRTTRRLKRAVWALLFLTVNIWPPARAQQPGKGSSLSVSPAQLDFGETIVGSATAAQTLTIRNAGQDPVMFANILISGIDFSQTNTCGSTLEPGTSCAVEVTFKPVTSGPRLGTVSVDARPGGLHIIPLNGAGK